MRLHWAAQGIEPVVYNDLKWSIVYKNTESVCCIVYLKLIKYINHLYFNFLKKELTE